MTGDSRRLTEEEKMPRRLLLAIAVPVALMAAACAGTSPVSGPSTLPIEGGSGASAAATGLVGPVWKLTRYEASGQPPVTVPAPEKFTAQFGEGRVAVLAECNRCGGGYSATDSTLSVGPMACTRAQCASAPLDTTYVAALQAARSYAVTGQELVIVSDAGRLRFMR